MKPLIYDDLKMKHSPLSTSKTIESKVPVVSTYTELRAVPAGTVAILSHPVIGGIFTATSDVVTDDGGVYIVGKLSWVRIGVDRVNAGWYTHDFQIDAADALMAALAFCALNKKTIYSVADYVITIAKTVDFRRVEADMRGIIKISNDAAEVICGGQAGWGVNRNQYFGIVQNMTGTDRGTPLMRIIGATGMYLDIERCWRVVFWGDNADYGAEAYAAYSTFTLRYVTHILVDAIPIAQQNINIKVAEAAGKAIQTVWFNENTFFLKRTQTFEVTDNLYICSNNIIHHGTFEGNDAYIKIGGYARCNHFHDLRFEGKPIVEFGVNTDSNSIEYTYYNAPTPAEMPARRVRDEGRLNVVAFRNNAFTTPITLLNIGKSFIDDLTRGVVGFLDEINPTDITRGAGKITIPLALKGPLLFESDYISTPRMARFTVQSNLVGGVGGFRVALVAYDADYNEVSAPTGWTLLGTGSLDFIPWALGTCRPYVNTSRALLFYIMPPINTRIKYVKVFIRAAPELTTFTHLTVLYEADMSRSMEIQTASDIPPPPNGQIIYKV